MVFIAESPIIETVTDVKRAQALVASINEKSPVLAEVRLYVYRGSPAFALLQGDQVLSIHVCHFGKRKHNIWEPYLNWYTAYTPILLRRQGFARKLAEHTRKIGIEKGCVRLKSKAGTILGVELHLGLNDQFWGVTEAREAIVDTPLVDKPEYLNRTPPNATKDAGTNPWTREMLMSKLAGTPMRYER